MTDPFVDRIKRARTDKGETVSRQNGWNEESEDLRREKRNVRSGGQYRPGHK